MNWTQSAENYFTAITRSRASCTYESQYKEKRKIILLIQLVQFKLIKLIQLIQLY